MKFVQKNMQRAPLGLFVLGLGFSSLTVEADVLINEVMPSNHSRIRDEEGKFQDWVEIINTGDKSERLFGYGLSDDLEDPFKWRFPDLTLKPGEQILVFASGLNRKIDKETVVLPSRIPGLVLWLAADSVDEEDASQVRNEADRLYVRKWIDSENPHRAAIQAGAVAQPLWITNALNGKPAVRFDGINDFLESNSASNEGQVTQTILLVVAKRSTVGDQAVVASRDYRSPGLLGKFEVWGSLIFTDSANAWNYITGGGGVRWVWTTTPEEILPEKYYLLSALQEGYQSKLYKNGRLAAFSETGMDPVPSRTWRLGADNINKNPTSFFNGDIAEIVIYNRSLNADEHRQLINYLTKKYGFESENFLHTNFALDADGEQVILTSPRGTVLDHVDFSAIPLNYSYGRARDGMQQWRLFKEPTPGSENQSDGYLDQVSKPVFSKEGGFYRQAFQLTLSGDDSETVIRYTTDGSEPNAGSPIYTGPILIENRENEPNNLSMIGGLSTRDFPQGDWRAPSENVFKGTVIRVKAFKEGHAPSETVTHSYFISGEGEDRYKLPVISLVTDRDNLFDGEKGIYVAGTAYENNIPGSIPNFQNSGDEWERPIHIEFFESNGRLGFESNAGVRIFGGATRKFAQKSLRLKANAKYGEQWFEYPVFPELPYKRYKQIILRNSGNDWWLTLFRDALMHRLVGGLEISTEASRPAIVFINGEYWGIYNLRERQDEHYLTQHFPGTEEQFQLYQADGGVLSGIKNEYTDLIRFIKSNEVSDPGVYQEILNRIDLDGYLDFQVPQIYFDNVDAGGNIRFWKHPGIENSWRYMIYDTDMGFGRYGATIGPPYANNTLQMATEIDPSRGWPYPEWSTFFLRTMMQNQDFKTKFINRMADYLNTIFKPGKVIPVIDEMASRIEPEMPEHLIRWPYIGQYYDGKWFGSMDAWNENVQTLRTFALERPDVLREQLIEYFGLEGLCAVNIVLSDANAGFININQIKINPDENGLWDGIYFKGIPILISAQPNSGFRFLGWSGDVSDSSAELTLNLSEAGVNLTAHFEPVPSAFPNPYPLAKGDYVFDQWSAQSEAGTYPPHMIFQQTDQKDPSLEEGMDGLWTQPYDLSQRSRINGLGEEGISLVNTGNPQAEGGGYLGAAVLALDTTGMDEVWVSWTSGTVQPNDRAYGIRLRYRVEEAGPFHDVLDEGGGPVEYAGADSAGHALLLGPARLPHQTANQPLVFLQWKYFYLDTGGDGPRAELRLDDIRVSGEIPRLSFEQWLKRNLAPGQINNPEVGGDYSDPDQDGRLNLMEYAVGSNPVLADSGMGLSFQWIEEEGKFYPSVSYSRNKTAKDVMLTLESSANLRDWEETGDPVERRDEGVIERITVRESNPTSMYARRFYRLKVNRK